MMKPFHRTFHKVLMRNYSTNPQVYFNVAIKCQPEKTGKLVFELRADVAPKTCENFRALCTGEKGIGHAGKPLHYANNIFHRVIPRFMAQFGDITRQNGMGGESIYGDRFEDENFTLRHDGRGILSMANAGPDTNGSQVFVTFVPCPWLDGNHTVFGRLVEGEEFLSDIEAEGSDSGKPNHTIQIIDCGEVKTEDEL